MSDDLLPRKTPDQLRARDILSHEEATAVAREIVQDVKRDGVTALQSYTVRFDGRQPSDRLFYDRNDMRKAWEQTPLSDRSRLERIAERIGSFAKAQRDCLRDLTMDVPGGQAGHTVRALRRAGCYAPAGTYPLPSTVLMTCVTAKAAGVSEVWVASPSPSRVMLAASYVGGADGFLAAGGAHAIGALAYGAQTVPPCDVVVGPGNRYVTAAKRLVAGDVAIDMAAGPSELVILADETANPCLVAADLLGQAEHDTDAWPVVISTSRELIDNVQRELRRQLESLPTASVARIALQNGGACLVSSLEEGMALCDQLAPEHVQVCARDSVRTANGLSDYGALFVGEQTPEVLGDYGMGPNHVLPTSGVARSFGGLSVFTFLRVNTNLKASSPMDELIREDVTWLARAEGLEGHARAIEARLADSSCFQE